MSSFSRLRAAGAIGLAALAASLVPGCVLPEIDRTDFPCPCASGFVCIADRCVPQAEAGQNDDAGPVVRTDGGRDAGRDSGAPSDGGVPTTECRLDSLLATAAFCDGFENPGLVGWDRDIGAGFATDVTAAEMPVAPYRGGRAMRANITSTVNGYGELITCPFRPSASCDLAAMPLDADDVVSGGDVWMRAYVYVPADVPIAHVSFMHMGLHREDLTHWDTPASANLDGEGTNPAGTTGTLMYLSSAISAHVPAAPPYGDFPLGEWVCVRTHIHVANGTEGSAETFVNENQVVTATGVDTLPDQPYLHFGIGIGWVPGNQQVPFEMFFDEVAVSRVEIPCD